LEIQLKVFRQTAIQLNELFPPTGNQTSSHISKHTQKKIIEII